MALSAAKYFCQADTIKWNIVGTVVVFLVFFTEFLEDTICWEFAVICVCSCVGKNNERNENIVIEVDLN